ncbi:MAG: sensor histidine kinase [Bacteroidetes bacterium]|nr:sensor histidine kinase [Bacteroidota bacterium]
MDQTESIRIGIIGGILVFFVLAILIAWLIVYLNKRAIAHQSEVSRFQLEKQKELLDASFQVQEQERDRIGRDIHDEIGPSLSTVKFAISQFQYLKESSETKDQIKKLNLQLTDIIQQVRSISRDLAPSSLNEFGLLVAIEELLDRIEDSGALQTRFECTGQETELSPKTELAIYRIVQELCNNALRHAAASLLQVSVHFRGKSLQLVVSDNGKGMDTNAKSSGIGLKNIEARISLIDGTWKLESSPARGTQNVINIPVKTFAERP